MSKDIFAWGHKHLNEHRGLQILEQNILTGQYLHSSYDYPEQFKIIKEVAKRCNKKIKLISKIYLNIPFYNMIAVGATKSNSNGLNRYGSLLFQTSRVYNYFENYIDELVIQICSIPKEINFSRDHISKFLKIINSEFKINKIFVETFPEAENSSIKIMKFMLEEKEKFNFKKDLNFGFAGYENLDVSGFTKNIKQYIEKKKLMIMPMQIFSGKSKIKSDEFIINSVKYIENLSNYSHFFRGVTSTSNFNNYKFLKSQNEIIYKNPINRKKNFIEFSYNNSKLGELCPYKINYGKKNYILLIKRFLLLIKALLKNPKFLKILKKTSFIE